MSVEDGARFELRKITDTEWLILDHQYPGSDPLHTVACIHDDDGPGVDVVWVREAPLPRKYLTPFDVLDDVHRLHQGRRSGRPVPIPHFPPYVARA